MYECRIEIAGIPALVRCRHPENADFFREYLTAGQERFVIEPGDKDLQRIREAYERKDAAEGLSGRRRTEVLLENSAIHYLLAERLIPENVLLMHGSALCMDGEAYLFIAGSGTGKSTHARLWRQAFGDRVWMINDDKPMLRFSGDDVTVYGTPWGGGPVPGRNAGAPLKAVVRLRRDETDHIEPLSKTEAFPELVQYAFRAKDPALMAKILELEKILLNAADFYSLGCTMEPDAAVTARAGINSVKRSQKWKTN